MLSKNTRKGENADKCPILIALVEKPPEFPLYSVHIFKNKTNKRKLSGTATVFKITEVPTAQSYHYNSLN